MALALANNLQSAHLPSQLGAVASRLCLFKPRSLLILNRSFAGKAIRASSAAFVEKSPRDPVVVEKEFSADNSILACPICYQPFSLIGDRVLSVDSASGSSLQCNSCRKTYSGKKTHLELITASGARVYGDAMPPATEIFRIPFVSFLYERGWRQNFIWLGFPGPEREFEMMKDYLNPVLGGNIVDASCGSGLFARLFAKSGLFSLVVALDYSENMLNQCYEFVEQEDNFPKEKLLLVRADISRLPFASGSVDAVHAGAAIHCWPSPSLAVAEISRVLRPGGVFVGTTYIHDGPFNLIPFYRPLRQNVSQFSGSRIFLSERELEDVCTSCGLVGFTCKRNRRFIMFSVTKPN